MGLPEDFRIWMRKGIVAAIENFTPLSLYNPREKTVWKYTDKFNFHYGKYVGELYGIAFGTLWCSMGLENIPSTDDQEEIKEMIEEYASEIRAIIKKRFK